MSTVLFTEVKLTQIAEQRNRQSAHTHSPALSCGQLVTGCTCCHSVDLSVPQMPQMIHRAKCKVESRVLRLYVLVHACRWLLLKGRGMCGIQLNMSA